MPDEMTPMTQAQHFVAHACRALAALGDATEPTAPEFPMHWDMFSAVYAVLVKLFPDDRVHAARAEALTWTGIEAKPDLTETDTLTLMRTMVELLVPPRRPPTDA